MLLLYRILRIPISFFLSSFTLSSYLVSFCIRYCLACHGGGRKEGKDSLEGSKSLTLATRTQKGLKDSVEDEVSTKKRRSHDTGDRFFKKL